MAPTDTVVDILVWNWVNNLTFWVWNWVWLFGLKWSIAFEKVLVWNWIPSQNWTKLWGLRRIWYVIVTAIKSCLLRHVRPQRSSNCHWLCNLRLQRNKRVQRVQCLSHFLYKIFFLFWADGRCHWREQVSNVLVRKRNLRNHHSDPKSFDTVSVIFYWRTN